MSKNTAALKAKNAELLGVRFSISFLQMKNEPDCNDSIILFNLI